MRSFLLSVYDDKAQVFCAPFISPTLSVAIRDFAYAANDKTTPLGKYPTDYTLFSIGEWDDVTGEVILGTHKSLGSAAQYVNQNEVLENV